MVKLFIKSHLWLLFLVCAVSIGIFGTTKSFIPSSPITTLFKWVGFGGYCTDWAYQRWQEVHPGETLQVNGNAWEWYGYAQNHNMSAGSTPRVGAIAVWGQYIGGTAEYGHVAIVEQVYSGTSFRVSEMNWSCGRGCKDERTVNLIPDINFIYSKGGLQPPPPEIREYSLISDKTKVYFIERGKKRYVGHPDTLNSLIARYGHGITLVSSDIINRYPTGRQVPDVFLPNTANNILVQGSEGRVFVMKSGLRRYLFNFNQIDPDDGDFYYGSDVRTLADNTLLSIPIGAPMYENNMFLSCSNCLLYIVDKGKKRPIPNMDTYTARGAGPIRYLPQSEIDKIPEGRMVPDINWPSTHDDVLVWSYPDDNGRVYVMKDGKRHYLSGFSLTDINDGDSYYPSDVRTVPVDTLSSIPIGAPIYNDGMLFSWPNGRAYIIDRNKRRYIPDLATLTARSGGKQVSYLTQAEVEQIPEGRIVPSVNWPNNHDNVLVWAYPDDNGRVYVMKSGKKRYLANFNLVDTDDHEPYYPSDVRILSSNELGSIPTGAPIYNDGMLFSWTNGPTYIIDRGKRRYVPDLNTLTIRAPGRSVTYLPEDEIRQIPEGRIVPSVSWPNTHDYILLQQTGSSDTWLMKDGKRNLLTTLDIVDPDGDFYYSSDIRILNSLESIPIHVLDLPLALSMKKIYWANYQDYLTRKLSVDFLVKNKGLYDAFEVTIKESNNTRGIITVSTDMFKDIGNILAGEERTVTLTYTIPPRITNFKASLKATAKDANTSLHTYPD